MRKLSIAIVLVVAVGAAFFYNGRKTENVNAQTAQNALANEMAIRLVVTRGGDKIRTYLPKTNGK